MAAIVVDATVAAIADASVVYLTFAIVFPAATAAEITVVTSEKA